MLEIKLQSKWIAKLKKDLRNCWIMKATVTNKAGAPDAILIYKGRAVAIEFKIHPNKLSMKQEYERTLLLNAGALYFVVDQFTDYKKTLETINAKCPGFYHVQDI